MLLGFCLNGSGCLGTKNNILRQSLTPIPADAEGLLYVATNKPIPVGIEGTDKISREDMGGYYLIHKLDYAAVMEALDGKLPAPAPTPAPISDQGPVSPPAAKITP